MDAGRDDPYHSQSESPCQVDAPVAQAGGLQMTLSQTPTTGGELR
jgi:hypothetical protein